MITLRRIVFSTFTLSYSLLLFWRTALDVTFIVSIITEYLISPTSCISSWLLLLPGLLLVFKARISIGIISFFAWPLFILIRKEIWFLLLLNLRMVFLFISVEVGVKRLIWVNIIVVLLMNWLLERLSLIVSLTNVVLTVRLRDLLLT